MRVLVTGATGFVGRWMVAELESASHQPIPAPGLGQLDITDPGAVRDLVLRVRPQGIVHLAGVAYARDAAQDPGYALAVNEGGTRNVVQAAAQLVERPAILVSGSSEVYGRPRDEDLPLAEAAPTQPTQPYGQSKLAQERVALEDARASGLQLVATRSFNHTGPGQRAEFVAPALARRVLAARAAGERTVSVGNIDVRRDFSDVRDVVRAYRLLLEVLATGAVAGPMVVNVGSGVAVSIREILERLAAIAGIDVEPDIDPDLVRADDPELIVADVGRLKALTGWQPAIPLERTLSDLVASLQRP